MYLLIWLWHIISSINYDYLINTLLCIKWGGTKQCSLVFGEIRGDLRITVVLIQGHINQSAREATIKLALNFLMFIKSVGILEWTANGFIGFTQTLISQILSPKTSNLHSPASEPSSSRGVFLGTSLLLTGTISFACSSVAPLDTQYPNTRQVN